MYSAEKMSFLETRMHSGKKIKYFCLIYAIFLNIFAHCALSCETNSLEDNDVMQCRKSEKIMSHYVIL